MPPDAPEDFLREYVGEFVEASDHAVDAWAYTLKTQNDMIRKCQKKTTVSYTVPMRPSHYLVEESI